MEHVVPPMALLVQKQRVMTQMVSVAPQEPLVPPTVLLMHAQCVRPRVVHVVQQEHVPLTKLLVQAKIGGACGSAGACCAIDGTLMQALHEVPQTVRATRRVCATGGTSDAGVACDATDGASG